MYLVEHVSKICILKMLEQTTTYVKWITGNSLDTKATNMYVCRYILNCVVAEKSSYFINIHSAFLQLTYNTNLHILTILFYSQKKSNLWIQPKSGGNMRNPIRTLIWHVNFRTFQINSGSVLWEMSNFCLCPCKFWAILHK